VRANLKWKLVTQVVGSMLVLMLAIGLTSCDRSTTAKMPDRSVEINSVDALATTDGPLSEVNIPASIAKLAPNLDKFRPQVKIISPQPDRVLNDDRVDVKLQVSDLPIFKNPELGLGNHLHVILDKQTYQGVYDLNQPLVFKNLAAGTHTLRVFASRPWHESFKNEGAYAQVTFHVLTKTAENNPDPQQPLLTYSRPTGIYGAEPIMLDYYLTNAPTHAGGNGTSEQIPDWKIRATVNNQQFIIDRWTPVYLQGFKPGKNWVRLELVDDRGNPLPNIYNDTTSIITYDPQAKDTLAKLVSGELDPNLTGALIDPHYVAAKPELVPIPVATPAPVQVQTPSPTPAIVTPPLTAKPTPSPILVAPAQPLPQPLPLKNESGTANPAPANVPALQPQVIPSPVTPAPIPNSNQIPTVTQPIVIPSPVTVQMPTVTELAQPNPAPALAPNPAQLKIDPAPIPVAPPIPMATPVPSPVVTNPAPTATVPLAPVVILLPPVAQNPVVAVPQPIIIPSPVGVPQPTVVPFTPTTSIRSIPPNPPTPPITRPEQQVAQAPANGLPSAIAIVPAPLPQQNLAPIAIPAPATPQVEGRSEQTWQTQAIELIKIAGVKIRAFTNTIPGKAQRFGHNVQIFTGKAIETIQSWRNQP
jgi:hypothetical protein